MYSLQGDADIFVPRPRVAINARGTVFVTWQWPHTHTFYARAAILTPASGWRKPRTVALPGPARNPVIAGDDRGFATVLWEGANGIEQADLSPSARVLDTRALPGGRYGLYPELTADANGDLAATWISSFDAFAAVRPAGHKWCPRINLTLAPQDAQVAIAPGSVGQVIWEHRFGRQFQPTIVARSLPLCRSPLNHCCSQHFAQAGRLPPRTYWLLNGLPHVHREKGAAMIARPSTARAARVGAVAAVRLSGVDPSTAPWTRRGRLGRAGLAGRGRRGCRPRGSCRR